jgi:hypothetical protein
MLVESLRSGKSSRVISIPLGTLTPVKSSAADLAGRSGFPTIPKVPPVFKANTFMLLISLLGLVLIVPSYKILNWKAYEYNLKELARQYYVLDDNIVDKRVSR